jgi:cytochrome bd ubiquinol oxidase subunit II
MEIAVATALVVSLLFYAISGGADYGAGLWDLLARGRRASEQRRLIEDAIGPIWEANHVWLILVIVILFTAFPAAFAAIATALHIPLTLLLIGIVLRGSAFTFRSYTPGPAPHGHYWGGIFSAASTITPILLGIILGTIATGKIRFSNGVLQSGFFTWLSPFPFAVGFFALSLFAFLAAVYLTVEADKLEIQEDFRLRSLIAALAVGVMALIVFLLSSIEAPRIFRGIASGGWALMLHIVTGIFAVGTFYFLFLRRYKWARAFAILQVVFILSGWAAAQYPYIIEPDFTVHSAAAPEKTLKLLLIALIAGALLLFPCLAYLFRIFKPQRGDEISGHKL